MPGGIGIGIYGIVFKRQYNRLYTLEIWADAPVCLAVINGDIPAYNTPNVTVTEALSTVADMPEPQVNDETLRI